MLSGTFYLVQAKGEMAILRRIMLTSGPQSHPGCSGPPPLATLPRGDHLALLINPTREPFCLSLALLEFHSHQQRIRASSRVQTLALLKRCVPFLLVTRQHTLRPRLSLGLSFLLCCSHA
ncbi:hypothetical protein H1C71_015019 [Ictidomys tridecemlineatus]|nr:hypothetical protein H1C71_015019 [Ictidomys tridecemlineatus]